MSSNWMKVFILSFFLPLSAQAINVDALYVASCMREVGLILDVDRRYVSILTLEGRLKKLQRHEVIYTASYPLDFVPIQEFSNPQTSPILTVDSYQNYTMKQFVRGWPIDFSDEKVSFLTTSGTEAVIKRRNMWKLAYSELKQGLSFKGKSNNRRYDLVHPYAFAYCKKDIKGRGRQVQKVYPQQLLSDPVMIKRRFDHLEQGHQSLRKYNSDQQFYPAPEVYRTHSTLGMWYLAGSRYGSSNNRNNNFTPLLIDEYSSGPFQYQHQFYTGSGPMFYSIHEETQTQVYYRFKADYFHMSFMFDPSIVLIGGKYDWSANDLEDIDVRATENGLIEMGFDYGPMAFDIVMVGAIDAAARFEGLFQESSNNLGRVGFTFHKPRYKANLYLGSSDTSGTFDLSFFRFNFEFDYSRRWNFVGSFIRREINYDGITNDEFNDYADFVMKSTSSTISLYTFYAGRQLNYGGMASIEMMENNYGITRPDNSTSEVYPKVGAMISLTF